MEDANARIDYDKENECCICLLPLYDNLQQMSIDEATEMNRKIFAAKIKKASTN